MDNNGYGDNNDMYGHWPPAPDGNNGTGNAAQLTPDDITMLQAATGLPSSGHNPSSMLPGQHVVYSQHENWTRQSVSVDNSYSEQPSFAQDDSQMLDREGHEDANYMATTATTRKTNGSRTSANNEAEMRQLFLANQNRSIQEVAGELHGNDRGPNSERTRQIFAMLWYAEACIDSREAN
jgi:regulatory factor X